MRALPRSSNDRAGQAARASDRRAHGTVTVGVPTKGMRTGATTVPPSRATEGPARGGMATPGTLTGDRVTVEMSPYDLEKGRLIFRHKDERPSGMGGPPRPGQRGGQFRRR